MDKKQQIDRLIREYYDLDKGVHIDNYLSLILVCDYPVVYISKRSLKHFIERRKEELLKNNSFTKVVEMLISMVLHIEVVIKNPDLVIVEDLENKIIYEKIYNKESDLSIRVITEIVENHQEIKSLHFVKIKKPP